MKEQINKMSFGRDFQLPQNAYAESCAGCGLEFFAREMRDRVGADRAEAVRERVLYNNVLGSVSRDGLKFYYQNPLSSDLPRTSWHKCPCCVGNVPRTLLALKDTVFSVRGDTIFVNQYMDVEGAKVSVGGKAYAPLFANAQHLAWSPNLINVVSDGCFVSPSWNVQRLFSEYRGNEVLDCYVDAPLFEPGEKNSDGSPMTAPSVAASAVKTTGGAIVLKVVNPTTCAQSVRLNLKGRAKHVLFTGPEADACNSLYDRESLKEVTRDVVLDGVVELPPLSLSVYVLDGQQGDM